MGLEPDTSGKRCQSNIIDLTLPPAAHAELAGSICDPVERLVGLVMSCPALTL